MLLLHIDILWLKGTDRIPSIAPHTFVNFIANLPAAAAGALCSNCEPNNNENKGPLYIWAWQTEARERQPCVTSAKKTCEDMIATRTCTAGVKRIQSTLEDNTNKARKGNN